jgi:hypothetical protein
VTTRDNNMEVLRFVHTEIISYLAQRLLFSRKKLAKQKVFVIGQDYFYRSTPRKWYINSEYFKVLLLRRKLLKHIEGSAIWRAL